MASPWAEGDDAVVKLMEEIIDDAATMLLQLRARIGSDPGPTQDKQFVWTLAALLVVMPGTAIVDACKLVDDHEWAPAMHNQVVKRAREKVGYAPT